MKHIRDISNLAQLCRPLMRRWSQGFFLFVINNEPPRSPAVMVANIARGIAKDAGENRSDIIDDLQVESKKLFTSWFNDHGGVGGCFILHLKHGRNDFQIEWGLDIPEDENRLIKSYEWLEETLSKRKWRLE